MAAHPNSKLSKSISDRCAFQHPPGLLAPPCTTPCRPDPASVESLSNLPERHSTRGPQLLDDGSKVCSAALGLDLTCGKAGRPAFVASDRQVAPVAAELLPWALAAARASLVRFEIMRRSSSAIMAMMPTVGRLGLGMSAATKSTPASPDREGSAHRGSGDPAS
jgi:hypothetical protein